MTLSSLRWPPSGPCRRRRAAARESFAAACAVAALLASPAAAAGLPAPKPASPEDGARVQSLPAFAWQPVRRAAEYEFQLAADRRFGSLVGSTGGQPNRTANRYATVAAALPNGEYFWRVRAVRAGGATSRWSPTRSVRKRWTAAPKLLAPADEAEIRTPAEPAVLSWSPVEHAYKYLVTVATDPALAAPVLGGKAAPLETSGTSFALPATLAPGRYYWSVTAVDAKRHKGAASAVGSFTWAWPSATRATLTDVDAAAGVFDPEFSWEGVLGAASYEVEVNSQSDWAPGSKFCCDARVIGTALSPVKVLPNNSGASSAAAGYYWRVRAVDARGNPGQWNDGGSFRKDFANVEPSIAGLRLADNEADPAPGPSTASPLLIWEPVPGAASYQVHVVPTIAAADPASGCDWNTSRRDAWDVFTATAAWTPLSGYWNLKTAGTPFRNVGTDVGRWMRNETAYCVRVRARSDRDRDRQEVVSAWTQLHGAAGWDAAFVYSGSTAPPPPPVTTCTAPAPMTPEDYLAPVRGELTTRMPRFRWRAVRGAESYYVIVARDEDLTDVVDVALTQIPAYAPRAPLGQPRTYSDETTSYYWAVLPAGASDGSCAPGTPSARYPMERFNKRSTPPSLTAPANASVISGQPTFRWSGAEGARSYRLQVSQDPTFGRPIDEVTTNSTAHTATLTYPADTVLYWRVRANDENNVGLTWSATGTFERRLPVPVPASGNPTAGSTIPVLRWSSVPGAVSYDIHVDQADGTTKDFRTDATAFTPTAFYGTGIWHWQVRANFATATANQVASGAYSPRQPFARSISAVSSVKQVRGPGRVLLTWAPAAMAKEYRVQVSTSRSFGQIVDDRTTAQPVFAPDLLRPGYREGGRLFLRVAVVDEGGNVGAWVTRRLRLPEGVRINAFGLLRRGTSGTVRVALNGRGNRPLKGLRLRVAGAGVRPESRRSAAGGVTVLRITPRRGGSVRITASGRGFRTASARVKVS